MLIANKVDQFFRKFESMVKVCQMWPNEQKECQILRKLLKFNKVRVWASMKKHEKIWENLRKCDKVF